MYNLTDVKAVVETLPHDRVNPTTPMGTCLYVDPNDPDKHCIAGQVFAELNLPEYANFEGSAYVDQLSGIQDTFSDEALIYLDGIQRCADWATWNSEELGFEAWGFAIWVMENGKEIPDTFDTVRNMEGLINEYKGLE